MTRKRKRTTTKKHRKAPRRALTAGRTTATIVRSIERELHNVERSVKKLAAVAPHLAAQHIGRLHEINRHLAHLTAESAKHMRGVAQ